jgi:hypothetical protein
MMIQNASARAKREQRVVKRSVARAAFDSFVDSDNQNDAVFSGDFAERFRFSSRHDDAVPP